MSDTGTTDTPPAGPSPKRSPLTAKIGPFQVRGWLVLIAAGIVLGAIIRRRTGAGSSAGDPTTDSTIPGPFQTLGNSGTLPLNGGPGLSPGTDETNHSWLVRAAQLVAQHGGYDNAQVDAALRKVIAGDPVTPVEAAIYSLALSLAGTPPEDVPALTIIQGDSPTVSPPTMPTPTPTLPPVSVPVTPAQNPADVAKFTEAVDLKRRLNESVHGGPPISDADALNATKYFTTSDPTIDPTARFYWRLWLDQHGYAGKFT